MIIKGNLSPSQQDEGRRCFDKFNFINGLSYICVGETIIVLFAIKLNCPDYCIAILGSFFFLSNFCMPLGKLLMARLGAVKTVAYCWRLRNLSILLVAAAPLMIWLGVPQGVQWVIMIGAFAFYACRSIGMIGSQPIMGEITTADNRGKFTSRTTGLFYTANLLMLGAIMAVMNYSRDLWVFIATITTGAFLGLASTFFLSRITETEAIRASARKPVLADVLLTLRNSMRLRQLAASCVISSAITLTVPISMLALKRGYGISDDFALFFALAQMGGAVAISYLIRLLAEETGPRPLAILFYCLMIVLCLLWVVGPDTFKWYYVIWLFFLAGVAVCGTGVSMTHYFLISIPNRERVAASLTIYVISGVAAGTVGSLLGGGTLRYLNTFAMTPIDMFKAYFLVIMVVLLGGLILVSRLKPLADWNVREVLGLAFAPKDIMTLFNLYNIKQVANPREERADIDRLLGGKSELSEKALISYLNSPKFSLRARALSALGEIQFGPDAVKTILEELENGEYITAHIAAQIAGDHGLKEAIPLLRKYLDSQDIYLQGKAMLSLAQLRDATSYPAIKRIFRDTANPRLITHGAAALSEIGDDEAFRLLLDKTVVPDLPPMILYEIIYCMTHLAGQGDPCYQFLKLYSKDRNGAMLHLSEHCRALDDGDKAVQELLGAAGGDQPKKDDLVHRLLRDCETVPTGHTQFVAAFLRANPPASLPLELLLCLLLFYTRLPAVNASSPCHADV